MSIRVLVFPSANEPGLEILQALAKSNKIELLAGSSFDRAYDPSRVLVDAISNVRRLASRISARASRRFFAATPWASSSRPLTPWWRNSRAGATPSPAS
ncbi:MAG: hypothetical protein ACJ8DG_03340 [Microvirga sp.]